MPASCCRRAARWRMPVSPRVKRADIVPKLLAEVGSVASGFLGRESRSRVAHARTLRSSRAASAARRGRARRRAPRTRAQAAQRLAESSDYIGQVIKGFQGTDTGLGLPKAAGPQACCAPADHQSALYGSRRGGSQRRECRAGVAGSAGLRRSRSSKMRSRLAITAARAAPGCGRGSDGVPAGRARRGRAASSCC